MASLLQRVIQIVDRNSQPEPSPKYSLMTKLELSVLQTDIDEAQAKLNLQNALEQAHRDTLVAHYATLVYYASRFRDKLATRQWAQVPSEEVIAFSKADTEACIASGSHDDMMDEIAALETFICERQAEYDAIASGSKAGRA